MNIIYDESTEYSRLRVALDRYGVTMRQWSENNDADGTDPDAPLFQFTEFYATWTEIRAALLLATGGRMSARLVSAVRWLYLQQGTSSDNEGPVNSTREYLNGGHVFTC